MADDKKTPAAEEHSAPEATSLETLGGVSDQPAVETVTAEQTHTPTDNVIPFGGTGTDLPSPGEEDTREPWEKTQAELDAENKKPRRGRPPKEAAEQTGPEGEKKPEEKAARKGRPPKADKAAPDKAEKPVRDKVSQSKKAPAKGGPDKGAPPAPEPVPPLDPANIPRPVEQGQVVYLNLAELHAFHTLRDHPYKVQDDDKMKELVGTIQEHGVMTPATVRPEKDGNGYEIIAGHRRCHGSELAGLFEIPCIVREMTDFEAVQEMKISNKQRGDPSPANWQGCLTWRWRPSSTRAAALPGLPRGTSENAPPRSWAKITA